jgi:hypothetical protein
MMAMPGFMSMVEELIPYFLVRTNLYLLRQEELLYAQH